MIETDTQSSAATARGVARLGAALADPPARSRAARPVPFLRPIVFLGGLTSIGIELTASRLIAPYFGGSTFIWANLIGVTLAFLSLGYWLGGRVADRHPSPTLLFAVTAVGAVFAGLIPLMSRPILAASLDAFEQVDVGAFYGSLIGVLLLLALPVTLLGFVTPFAIRLRLDRVDTAGNTAGNIYALSTLGSIAGSFLPVIVLIPLFGTTRTFLILALALLVPSLLGLLLLRAVPAAVGAAILALLLPAVSLAAESGRIRPPDRGRLLAERESEYNYIQVLEEDGRTLLALNEGHAVHSIYDPDELLTGGPWDYFMAAPLVNEGAGPGTTRNALLIGLAGGTVARQLTAGYGPIPIDGVEIDPEVAAVGREYFGLDDLPNLNVIVDDGRYALRTTDQRYDLVGVDAYRQPYIPFQLTSREFFQEIEDRLTPNGVAVVNAGRTSTDFRLVDVIASTMRDVYDRVYLIDVERYANTIVVGTNAPGGVDHVAANAAAFPPGSPVRLVAERAVATGNIREAAPGGRVFTDDHAPVELVVDQIILDAAREGGGS
ncbi:MAG: fused MFS/spermidine synthase [Chloroflexota bacterium]|nr:fused MFS/spermidine synthase [Chloroflexota bacterium]